MKKTRTSLRTGFLTTILICWLVPIFIVVTLAGVLLNKNYRQSVQQEIASTAVRLSLGNLCSSDSATASNMFCSELTPAKIIAR